MGLWWIIVCGSLALGFALWRAGRRLRFFLHLLQLEGYRTAPLRTWIRDHRFDAVFRVSHAVGVLLIGFSWFAAGSTAAGILLLAWAAAFASSRRYRRDRPKKPLALTPRLQRLAAVSAAVPFALVLTGLVAAASLDGPPRLVVFLSALWIADLGAPVWVQWAAFILSPVERRIHEGFKRRARERLAGRPDLVVVAVTGSYGKTSVKFMIGEMLARRYNVLVTPGSFNTPMGVCRVINDRLRPEHQVLVLEMGIRRKGDIAELCAIARPHIAVITGIGIAHLETMGSEEAIAQEKGTLLEYLPDDGTAVLNADDAWYDALRERSPAPVVSVSPDGSKDADLYATEVRFGPDGTSFTVHEGSDRSHAVRLRLLGRHHVGNALLGFAVARTAGVRLRQAARAAAEIAPVPHRLALRTEGSLLVLDDAFNSNPVGARNALEVLGQFPGRRFVITPGMIELGRREVAENEAFGRAMVGRVDEVWLVGPDRTRPIAHGLAEAGFPAENVHTVHTLFEARDAVVRRARQGDVVLYENDLPDQYTER